MRGRKATGLLGGGEDGRVAWKEGNAAFFILKNQEECTKENYITNNLMGNLTGLPPTLAFTPGPFSTLPAESIQWSN
jgi:hypothetical protein